MKVTQEKLPASQIGLEIEITSEASKNAYEKTIKEFTRSVNIPGFRKGKVPRQVLVRQLGAQRIKATVLEELIESSIKEAIKQEDIKAIGNYQLRSSFDDLLEKFNPGDVITFSAAVDIPPEVVLEEYKGLSVKAEEVKYKPERVDEILEDYRNRMATLVPVEDRESQLGDVAIVDFAGRLTDQEYEEGDEAAEIPGGKAEDFQIELQEDRFIPGFVIGMVGMKPGETRELSVTFPDEYPQKDLAGKPAVFTVTLKDLKEKELPELDDDFAQEISEFETMAELRESLESRYQKEADEQTKSNKGEALTDELVKRLEVDLPETLIRRETDFLVTQTAMQLENQGLDIRKMMTPEIVEQLRQRSRPDAIDRLKRTLAMGEVAKRESVSVEPSEVEARVQEVMTGMSTQDVDVNRLRDIVEEDLIKEKVLAWLEENGTVELVPEGSLTPKEEETAVLEAELPEESPEEAGPSDEISAATATVDAVVSPADADEAASETESQSEEKTKSETKKSTKSASKSSKKTTKKKAESADADSADEA